MTSPIFPSLPPLWTTARVGELARIVYGKALREPNRAGTGGVEVYGSSGVVGEHDEPLQSGPSIVIGRKGTVGSIHYVDKPFWCIDTAFYLDDVSAVLDIEFLANILRAVDLGRLAIVVGVPGISRKDIEAQPIPLPPLPEQRRIADILRQAEALRKLRRQANERARDLLPALFYEMFGDRSTWEDTEPLSKFVTFVGGGTPSRKVERYFRGGIPWATSKDVKARYLDDTQEHITEEAIEHSATNLVPVGTILMVVKSKILMHSLPMGITTRPFCFGQDLKGLVPKKGVSPEYVYSALSAQASWLLPQARGVNTEGITLEMLRGIPIPKPKNGQQEEFVRRVKAHDAVLSNQDRSEHASIDLMQSLFSRAFTGVLTAAWREAHAAELTEAAVERDRLLSMGRESQAQQLVLPLEGATPAAVNRSFRNLAAVADEIARSQQKLVDQMVQISRVNLIDFTALAESLRPAVASMADVVNSAMKTQLAAINASILDSMVRAAQPLADALRSQQTYYADLLQKMAQVARIELDEPMSRSEIEAEVLETAAELPNYFTLFDLVRDWRLNHFARHVIQESVDMLVVLGKLRSTTLKLETGDPQHPYDLADAYALVRDSDLVSADEIAL